MSMPTSDLVSIMQDNSPHSPPSIELDDFHNPVLRKSQKYAEYCTMAYQLYANGLQNAFDPFAAQHGRSDKVHEDLREQDRLVKEFARKKLLEDTIKAEQDKGVGPKEAKEIAQAKVAEQAAQDKALGKSTVDQLEYVSYNQDDRTIDPREPRFYANEVYFEPPPEANKIGRVYRADNAEPVKAYENAGQDDSIDMYMFSGVTGETDKHAGVRSTMGYVGYNRHTKEITVTFRGSRSGSAEKGAVNGLYYGEGNPDWVTDMQLAGDLSENPEILKGGQVAEGFANTYLSCRPEIIGIMQRIRESDTPKQDDPKPTLVTTGHSLGGALASMMFIDTQRGTFAQNLKSKLSNKEDGFVDGLVDSAECFAFSAPPVCEKRAAGVLGDQSEKFHRVYFENDTVVTGANAMQLIRGKKDVTEAHKASLVNINSDSDISLEEYNEGGFFDFGCPHELYLVHEHIQRKLGIKEPKRYWYTVGDMMVTHASTEVDPEPLKPEQAAVIFNQFDFAEFLTLVKKEAEKEVYSEGEKEKITELMEYIDEIRTILQETNPYENPEKFRELQDKLHGVVSKLDGWFTLSNDEKWGLDKAGLYKALHKSVDLGMAVVNLGLVVFYILDAVREFCVGVLKGLYALGKYGVDKIIGEEKHEKENSPVMNSIYALKDAASKLQDKIGQFIKAVEENKNNPKELQNIMEGSSKFLTGELGDIIQKINKVKELTKDVTDVDVVEFLRLADELSECVKACKTSVSGLSEDLSLEQNPEKIVEKCREKYSELSASVYPLVSKYEKAVQRYNERRSGSLPVDNRRIKGGKDLLMTVTGAFFPIRASLVKTLQSVYGLGRSIMDFFRGNRSTKNYMRDIFKGVSKALDSTNYDELTKKVGNKKALVPKEAVLGEKPKEEALGEKPKEEKPREIELTARGRTG